MPKLSKLNLSLFLFFLFMIYGSRFTAVHADTHTAVSLSTQDVQNAINAASDGDTVQLPAGTAVWPTPVNLTNKGITIRGAGMDQTVIVDSTIVSWNQDPFYVTGLEGKPFRFCYLTMSGWDGTNTGQHSGGNGQSILGCNGKSWTAGVLVGFAVWNITDNSCGLITANSSASVTAVLSGGTRNNWNTGDSFKITDGYPCLDQIGRTAGTDLINGTTVQKSVPVYEWSNTLNGSPSILQEYTCITSHIQVGRDYYNCTDFADAVSKGLVYTPYTYPHPMTLGDVVDTTSPTAPGAVYDGTGADVNFTYSTTTLIANWTAGTDADTGVSGYQYAISAVTAGGTEFVNWTTLGNVLTVTKSGLSLTMGTTYYFTVRTIDGVELISPAANSNGQYVAADGTPPLTITSVRDGLTADIDFTYSTTTLSANWNTTTDPESGVSKYLYAIGTTACGTDITVWTNVSLSTTVTKTGLNLSVGTTYYFSVAAVNGAGLQSIAANSNGQYIAPDATPPNAPGVVRDGPTAGVDISITSSTTQLSASWTAGSDPDSGISGYQYAIGTTAGGTNTAGWTILGNVLNVTRGSLTLTVGSTYYYSVKSINGSGLTSTATNSNGVLVVSTADVTPPIMGVVRDGTGADISYAMTNNTLTANWDQASDPESGVIGYQYAIGSTAGGTDTANWTTLTGNHLSITRSTLTLVTGTTYYFSVKAINGNNLMSNAVNSNGQYVISIDTSDTTPPTNITAVRDGTGADISITANATHLDSNWDASSDPQSGIAKYWYAIGTTPGGFDTQGWTNNGQLNLISITITLTRGVTYYVSVKAENGVGLQSSTTTSNGVYVLPLDTTPPIISGVTAQNITANTATVAWSTNESATSQVEYGRTTSYGRLTIEDSTLNPSHSVALPDLIAGSVYHYRVISIDASGNEADSGDYTFTMASAGLSNPEIHAYPNPAKITDGHPMKFRIAGMLSGEVDIYTISGRLIKKQTGTTEISWDGKNTDGEKVNRGIYLYKIINISGDSVTGKLVLLK